MKIKFRSLASLALAVAMATVFSLSSFAAPDTSRSDVDPPAPQDCTGTLAVKGGSVTINGNAAQTGATVMSGAVVATSGGGKAILDFGPLGRIEVGGNSTLTINCAGGKVEVRAGCAKTEIKVSSGQVDVTSPGSETIAAGGKKTFDGAVTASSGAGASWSIECEGPQHAGAYIGPGWWGVIALSGVAAGIATGIALGEGDISPPSSPARP